MKLTQIEQQHTPISTLVLALLGDFITGHIHEELKEITAFGPAKAIVEVQNWIACGIEYILDKTDLNLRIVSHSGNHARSTFETQKSTENDHSWEYVMYHNLRRYFLSNPRVEFIVPEGYLSYVEVYDLTLCLSHGHEVRFGGGVGGLTIPMNKAIVQWESIRSADIYCLGHFHQAMDGGKFIVNGSMIGYNAYALRSKLRFERPTQIMFGIHSKLGKHLTRYIYFDA